MNETLVQPRGLRLWWMAIRPKTLGLAISPVILGAAIAWSGYGATFRPEVPLIIVLCAIAIQAGTNLFNDAQDHLNGTDDPARMGPPRITALGWALPHQVSTAALTAFLTALLGGLYLIQIGGWPIFFGGLSALWAGYLYSRGPYPVSRSPFGEVVVIAFFGLFAVGGTVFLMTGRVPSSTYLWGLVVGLPAGGVLMLNNIRDLDGDRRAGRRTLAILLGNGPARGVYIGSMLIPFVLIGLAAGGGLISPGALAGLAALPLAIKIIRALSAAPVGPALNPLLAKTVQFQFLLAISISLGLVIPGL